MQHITITGGAGFIGSWLAVQLTCENIKVAIIGSLDGFYDENAKRRNIRKLANLKNSKFLQLDISDKDALREHLKDNYSKVFVIAVRFLNFFSARQDLDLAIYKFVKKIMNGKSIPIFGDGSTRRDQIFIGDILKGIREAMKYDLRIYEVTKFGNRRSVPISEMISNENQEI